MKQSQTPVQQSPKNLAVEPVDIFKPLFSVVDKNHLKTCPCHQHLVEQRFEKLWDEELKEIDDDTPAYAIESRKHQLYEVALEQVAAELPLNTLCPLEVEATKKSLEMFVNSHYDLNNPVVYGIVRNALNMELASFRLGLLSKGSDLLVKTVDDTGRPHWVINPSVEASRKASESVIKAFEILSKIVDGQLNKNVNVNVEAKAIPFEELFKK